MKQYEKIIELSKGLDLTNKSISCYGKVNEVNVRISDHLPQIHNLLNYSDLLIKKDGIYKMYFVVVTDQRIGDDELERAEEEIVHYLSEELENEVEVKFEIVEAIEEDGDVDYIKKMTNIM